MRKALLLILLCVLFTNANAQKRFTFGPIAGGGFTLVNPDYKHAANTTITKTLNGSFMGGMFARISIKRLYIQPELYYGNRDGYYSFNYNYHNVLVNSTKQKNINLNTLLGIKFLKLSRSFNIRVFAGPSLSLIVAPNENYQNDNGSGYSHLSFSNYPIASFSLKTGVGVDISKFTIDLRYEKGLTDLYFMKINSLMLTVGFKIR